MRRAPYCDPAEDEIDVAVVCGTTLRTILRKGLAAHLGEDQPVRGLTFPRTHVLVCLAPGQSPFPIRCSTSEANTAKNWYPEPGDAEPRAQRGSSRPHMISAAAGTSATGSARTRLRRATQVTAATAASSAAASQ